MSKPATPEGDKSPAEQAEKESSKKKEAPREDAVSALLSFRSTAVKDEEEVPKPPVKEQDDGTTVSKPAAKSKSVLDDLPLVADNAGVHSNTRFPSKLMAILSTDEYKPIVSWSPDGTSFLFHDRKAFEAVVLPDTFKDSKFDSFLRKLYRWGFSKCQTYSKVGSPAYKHNLFTRDNPDHCAKMECRSKPRAQPRGGPSVNAPMNGWPASMNNMPFIPPQNGMSMPGMGMDMNMGMNMGMNVGMGMKNVLPGMAMGGMGSMGAMGMGGMGAMGAMGIGGMGNMGMPGMGIGGMGMGMGMGGMNMSGMGMNMGMNMGNMGMALGQQQVPSFSQPKSDPPSSIASEQNGLLRPDTLAKNGTDPQKDNGASDTLSQYINGRRQQHQRVMNTAAQGFQQGGSPENNIASGAGPSVPGTGQNMMTGALLTSQQGFMDHGRLNPSAEMLGLYNRQAAAQLPNGNFPPSTADMRTMRLLQLEQELAQEQALKRAIDQNHMRRTS